MYFIRRCVSVTDDEIWPEIKKRICAIGGKPSDLDRQVDWVKECMKKCEQMTVLRIEDLESTSDIDLAMLKAVFKGIHMFEMH